MSKPIHSAAKIFPLMSGRDFDMLVEDIRQHGLREPITLLKGEVLDGRNRLRACEAADVEPRFIEWTGNGTALEFVISKNLCRRHLSESQRAMIAARLAPGTRETAKQNLKSYQKANPDIRILTSDDTMTNAQASDAMNISHDTLNYGKIVLREGTQEEIEAVERGDATVSMTARKIRGRVTEERPKKKRTVAEQKHLRSTIWKNLKGALETLKGMPSAADVAAIATEGARGDTAAELIAPAHRWLEDFQNEWNKRRETNSK